MNHDVTQTLPGTTQAKFTVHTERHVLKARVTATCHNQCSECSSFDGEYCEHQTMNERGALFNKAMIPAVFLNATLIKLGSDPSSPSYAHFVKWIDKWAYRDPLPMQGMVISGPQGIGKSFAMAALIRFITLERGLACRFLDFGHFLMTLKNCYSQKGNEYDLFDEINNVHLLIIDDVGSFRNTEWSREILKIIIAARYNSCTPTFVTTNLLLESSPQPATNHLKQSIGEHSYSRLKHMCYWLSLDGRDRRDVTLPYNHSYFAE